jgi:hypothetical protein
MRTKAERRGKQCTPGRRARWTPCVHEAALLTASPLLSTGGDEIVSMPDAFRFDTRLNIFKDSV